MRHLNVVSVAWGELGYTEKKDNKTKYGEWFGLDGVPWCGIFVSWCYAMAGRKLPQIGFRLGFASCQKAFTYFKEKNMLTKNPMPGDIVLYDWKGDGNYNHTGIYFKGKDQFTFSAIEGNTAWDNQRNGGSVMLRVRAYRGCIFVHIPEEGLKLEP